jgi:hypothetical protein
VRPRKLAHKRGLAGLTRPGDQYDPRIRQGCIDDRMYLAEDELANAWGMVNHASISIFYIRLI